MPNQTIFSWRSNTMKLKKKSKTKKEEYCKVCESSLSKSDLPELANDGLCSYFCEDEYFDLLEDRYRAFDRWDSDEGRPC